jgi:hypothetical protein
MKRRGSCPPGVGVHGVGGRLIKALSEGCARVGLRGTVELGRACSLDGSFQKVFMNLASG